MSVFSLRPRFGWPTTIGMILLYSLVVAMVFMKFEQPPISYFSRFPTRTVVTPGMTIAIIATVERHKAGCPSIITREWQDANRKRLATIILDGPPQPAGVENYHRELVIPPYAETGDLWLRTSVNFRCNWVQKMFGGVDFVLPDLKFDVISRPMGQVKLDTRDDT